MNRLVSASLLMLASCMAAAAPAGLTIRDLVQFDRVADPQLSPDGRSLAYVLRSTDLDANSAKRAIWLMDLDGHNARKLTGGSGSSDTPTWSADGKTLYFLSTRSGSNQVWKLPLSAGGEAQQVTSLPLSLNGFLLSPRDDRIAVSMDVFPDCASLACSAERFDAKPKASGMLYDKMFVRHWDTWANGSRAQLYTLSLDPAGKAGEPVPVSKGVDGDVPSKPFGGMEEVAFSPDGKTLVFTARVAGTTEPWSTNLDLWKVPADGSAQPVNLTDDNDATDTSPVFTPDGQSLVYLAMSRATFEADRQRILIKELASGKTREVAPNWDRSPGHLALSADGKAAIVTADDLGQRPMFSVRLSDGRVSQLTGAGSINAYSVGSRSIVFAQNDLAHPDDLYRMPAGGGKATAISALNGGKLANIDMGAYEQFSFAGWNNETVRGFVVKPAGFQAGKKYPIAFIIHGGPQGSMGNLFHYRWNPEVFAGMGYAVVFVDFHGSTGYGQAFTDSISGDWGGKPLEDLQKGLAAAVGKFDFLDGDRACALGASYGGYMINWIAGNWPDRFRCLVNHDGVFDNRAMGYATEELWFSEWENGGKPWLVPENYERFNPANYVKNWKTPMLVVQGQLDYRIPVEQGLAAFTALQGRGIESQLLYFPDENHWVLKPQNSVQWYDTVQAWLARHLK